MEHPVASSGSLLEILRGMCGRYNFIAYLSTKGVLRWLTEAPLSDVAEQVSADASTKAQMVLPISSKDASLIRISNIAANAKAY